MITCRLYARTANQYFMLAAVIAHAKRMGTQWYGPYRTTDPRIWPYACDWIPKSIKSTKHFYKEPSHAYSPLPLHDDLTIEGYFQSSRYFEDAKPEVAQALRLERSPLDTVAIHVRRTDYLQYPDSFPVLPESYYSSAIDYMISQGYDAFKVYSDDIPWCRQMFNRLGASVEYSTGSAYDDIREIYNSAAMIIANSTFSLFPAVLREDNPLVVAPDESMWYGPKNKLETCDLMPERFVKIKV